MLLGGIETAVSGVQVASGALIMLHTMWRSTSPWERETWEVVLAVSALRVVKEAMNVASPLIEMVRQPALFDKNDENVIQVC